MFYTLLEQYEEDEFGKDDHGDGFPRWAIPLIIGAFFSLGNISMPHVMMTHNLCAIIPVKLCQIRTE